jgi:hypothetical protein
VFFRAPALFFTHSLDTLRQQKAELHKIFSGPSLIDAISLNCDDFIATVFRGSNKLYHKCFMDTVKVKMIVSHIEQIYFDKWGGRDAQI